MATSKLTAVFVATAARVLCAEYLTVSIPASASTCLSYLLIVSGLTALCYTHYQTDDNLLFASSKMFLLCGDVVFNRSPGTRDAPHLEKDKEVK